jgi:hypothetical protein
MVTFDELNEKVLKILPDKIASPLEKIDEKGDEIADDLDEFAEGKGPRYHTSVESLDSAFGDSGRLKEFVEEKLRSSEEFASAINYSTGKTTTDGMLVLTDKRIIACAVASVMGSTEAESIRLDSISSIDTEDDLTNIGVGGSKVKLNIKGSGVDNTYEVYTQADIEQFIDDCWGFL